MSEGQLHTHTQKERGRSGKTTGKGIMAEKQHHSHQLVQFHQDRKLITKVRQTRQIRNQYFLSTQTHLIELPQTRELIIDLRDIDALHGLVGEAAAALEVGKRVHRVVGVLGKRAELVHRRAKAGLCRVDKW